MMNNNPVWKTANELVEGDMFTLAVRGIPKIFKVKFIENEKVYVDIFTSTPETFPKGEWVVFDKEGIKMSTLEQFQFVVFQSR